jgi:RNA polymerase sigma-70 factor (ECF subfamily)
MDIMADQEVEAIPESTSARGATRELILRYKKGDRSAFRTLVEDHTRYAYVLAFRMLTDEEDAKDAVQEAFIRVWNHRGNFDAGMKFTTWLYRIVVNISYDKLRMRKRSWGLFRRSTDGDEVESTADLQQEMSNRDLAMQIRRFADGLPVKQRLVFVLRDLQEMPVTEVAEALHMSPAAVKTNLCFARRKIRAVFKDPDEKENERS